MASFKIVNVDGEDTICRVMPTDDTKEREHLLRHIQSVEMDISSMQTELARLQAELAVYDGLKDTLDVAVPKET